MAEAAGVFEDGVFRKGDVRLSDRGGQQDTASIGNDRFASVAETSVFIDKTDAHRRRARQGSGGYAVLPAASVRQVASISPCCSASSRSPSGSMRERAMPICSRGWPYGTPAMGTTGPIRALIRLCGSRSTT
ncbi:MAG: hypothetical protein ACLTDR_09555 [Adlercreutzia equolifaciens]